MKACINKILFAIAFALGSSVLVAAEASDEGATSVTNRTFVIVHGATGGGWDWKVVANKLTAQGHTVYRPTLTGLGEKVHLANKGVNLTTHILDVVNLIKFENLNDVVLVGHSYGGMVITGVMDRIPERLSHLTFLDAAAPDDGMSAIDVWGAPFEEASVVDGLVHFPWLNPDAEIPRDVPHPLASIQEKVSYKNVDAKKLNATFVAFVPKEMTVEERTNDPSWQRAKQRGWTLRTFEGDHVIYREKPNEIAALLVQACDDINDQ